MRLHNFLLSLLLCVSLSAAWPWPPTYQNIHNALARRQDDGDRTTRSSEPESTNTARASRTAEATTASETGRSRRTTDKDETRTGSAAETTKAAKTGDKDNKDEKTTKTSKSTKKTAAGGAAGMVVMTEPAQTSATYIKIGDEVTFKWNYTNLANDPSKIDVIATASDQTWTVTQNMTMKETGEVIWDTNDASPALGMAKYTLVVYDAEEGPTPTNVGPGDLNPQANPYQFAMYSPREPRGTGKSFCVTCSAAVTSTERQSIKVLMLVATVTVLSFTYFASGFLGI